MMAPIKGVRTIVLTPLIGAINLLPTSPYYWHFFGLQVTDWVADPEPNELATVSVAEPVWRASYLTEYC